MSSSVANRIVFDHKKSRHTLNGCVREGGPNKRKFTLKYPLKRTFTPNINKGLIVVSLVKEQQEQFAASDFFF